MALKDSLSGRRMDSFVQTSEGTATRVVTTFDDSSAGLVYSSGTTASVDDTAVALVEKTELNGKTGSWFVYNSGAKAIDVKMYSAYASGASNYAQPASSAIDWDQVGSTQTIAAGTTKHIPFNNVYRFVALAASTSTSQSLGVEAELYAIPN